MTETLATRNADCLLTVTATHLPMGQLALRCHLHNHGELALYVCSHLYELAPTEGADSSPRPDPNLVHIQVEPAGVRLDKSLMDFSFHDGIRVLDIPYLTQVLPGHAHEQTLSLPLPLHPYRVHGGHPGQAPLVSLPLWFSLGYFKGNNGITASELVTTLYQITTSHSQQQQVLTVGPFQEPVPVANATPSLAPAPAASPAQWTPWG